MAIDKSLLSGSTTLMLLTLLEEKDMYGYQIAQELERRSEHVFSLKAGTMYPLLHTLETKGWVRSYSQEAQGRERKYYALTKAGESHLAQKKQEWESFSTAVGRVLKGGALCGG